MSIQQILTYPNLAPTAYPIFVYSLRVNYISYGIQIWDQA